MVQEEVHSLQDATEAARWDAALRGVHDGAPAVVAAPATTALDALSTAGRPSSNATTAWRGAWAAGY